MSTTESEYMAAMECVKELVWILNLMDTLSLTPIQRPVCLYGDNQGANALSKNNQFHSKTKHIELRHWFINQLFDDNILCAIYIPTKEMLADGLTKPLPEEEHYRHFSLMGMMFDEKPKFKTPNKGFPSSKKECEGCGNLFRNDEQLMAHKKRKLH